MHFAYSLLHMDKLGGSTTNGDHNSSHCENNVKYFVLVLLFHHVSPAV